MSNLRKRLRKKRRGKGEKWDRGKGYLGEQFHFTFHIHPKRNVTSEFYLSHVQTFLYTWYHFISWNGSILVVMIANVM